MQGIDPIDITYSPLDLQVSPEELDAMAAELDRVPEQDWFWSEFRACSMLGVFTPGGSHERKSMSYRSEMNWSKPSSALPAMRAFCEHKLFPLLEPLGRIVVLKSRSGGEIPPHIDCTQAEFETLQHKIRVVLRGRRDTLYFLSEDEKRRMIDGQHPVYTIDGSHPHGMVNHGTELKYTLCLGWPWSGHGERYNELLARSVMRYPESVIRRSEIGRPCRPEWFQENYEKQKA